MVMDEGRLNGGCRSVNGAGVEEEDRWLGTPVKIGRVVIFPLLPIELADDQPDVQESVGVHALPFRTMAALGDAAVRIWIWVAKTARSVGSSPDLRRIGVRLLPSAGDGEEETHPPWWFFGEGGMNRLESLAMDAGQRRMAWCCRIMRLLWVDSTEEEAMGVSARSGDFYHCWTGSADRTDGVDCRRAQTASEKALWSPTSIAVGEDGSGSVVGNRRWLDQFLRPADGECG